jgi:hypothetical protein
MWRAPVVNLPKFHFMECRTINDMRTNGRFERYVITNKTTGNFTVTIAGQKRTERLYVCKNCLKEYNYRNYTRLSSPEQNRIVENFNIKKFFDSVGNLFEHLPHRNDTSINDDYPVNWNEIAVSYKESVNWCCENCHAIFAENRGLLDVHHRNGVKSDVDPSNLQALCKICHSEQFLHGHYQVTIEERRLIEHLRRQHLAAYEKLTQKNE